MAQVIYLVHEPIFGDTSTVLTQLVFHYCRRWIVTNRKKQRRLRVDSDRDCRHVEFQRSFEIAIPIEDVDVTTVVGTTVVRAQ